MDHERKKIGLNKEKMLGGLVCTAKWRSRVELISKGRQQTQKEARAA
jgi:hypothetical protein